MSALIIHFLVCGVTGLVLWLKMLSIMESKGIDVSYFVVHPGQYIDFYRIIKNENDLELKKRYRVIFWVQIALIPIYLIGGILLMRLI